MNEQHPKRLYDDKTASWPSALAPEAIDKLITDLPPVTPLAQLPAELQEFVAEQSTMRTVSNEQPKLKLLPNTDGHLYMTRPTQRKQQAPVVRILSTLAAVLVVAMLVGSSVLFLKIHQATGVVNKPTPTPKNQQTTAVVGKTVTPKSQQTAEVNNTPSTPYMFLESNPDNPNLPTQVYAFNPVTKTIVWRTTVNGSLNQIAPSDNPVIAATSTNGKVYLLNRASGAILWGHALSNPAHPNTPASPHDTFIDGDSIYIGSNIGFYALRVRDGSEIWYRPAQDVCLKTANLSAGVIGQCNLEVSEATNGVVYGFADGLYALNASDGKMLWHNAQILWSGNSENRGFVVSNNVIYTLLNESGQYSRLHALNASNGQEIKKGQLPVSSTAPEKTIVIDGVLYLMSVGPNYSRVVLALDSSDQHVLWSYNTQTESANLLGVSNGTAYLWESQAAGPSIVVLDAQRGTPRWQTTIPALIQIGGPISYDYTIFNDKVYIIYGTPGSGLSDLNLCVVSNGNVDVQPIKLS